MIFLNRYLEILLGLSQRTGVRIPLPTKIFELHFLPQKFNLLIFPFFDAFKYKETIMLQYNCIFEWLYTYLVRCLFLRDFINLLKEFYAENVLNGIIERLSSISCYLRVNQIFRPPSLLISNIVQARISVVPGGILTKIK